MHETAGRNDYHSLYTENKTVSCLQGTWSVRLNRDVSYFYRAGREEPDLQHKLLADAEMERSPFDVERERVRGHTSDQITPRQSLEAGHNLIQQVSTAFLPRYRLVVVLPSWCFYAAIFLYSKGHRLLTFIFVSGPQGILDGLSIGDPIFF
jgi:hypothetical protein